MLKVLIVDDEPFVRQDLEAIIDWEKYGFYICGEAENGAEALEMIREHSPNLVITDIKMPEIDGLEMIRIAAREMNSAAKFIILSGYEDFSYARSAIKYNVVDYILKPIDEAELIEILNRFREDIYKELAKDKDFSMSVKTLANETIKRLVEGEINSNVMLYARQWLSLNENEQTYYVLVEIDNYDEWLNKLNSADRLKSCQLVEDIIFKSIGRENALNLHRELVYRYGIIAGSNILYKYNFDIKSFTSRLYKDFACSGGLKVFIYAGARVENASEIKKSYRTCHELIKYFCANPENGNITHYDDMEGVSYSYDINSIKYFSVLQEDIENNRKDEIKSNVENLFVEIQEKLIAPEIIKAYIIKFEFDIFASVSQLEGDANKVKDKIAFPDLNETRMNNIKKNLIQFCTECANYYKFIKENKSKSLLCGIESYIQKNYKSDISLKSLAEVFYINPVYLGQLFKKNFGMYFNDYLHKLRAEEAMKLLKTTDFKIYEIAYMVGYTDNNYFASKFEKISGMTPSQYKKSNS